LVVRGRIRLELELDVGQKVEVLIAGIASNWAAKGMMRAMVLVQAMIGVVLGLHQAGWVQTGRLGALAPLHEYSE